MISSKKRKKPTRKQLAIIAVVTLAAVATFILWKTVTQNTQTASEKSSSTSVSQNETINLDPPTDEEKQAGEDQKDKIVEEQNNPPVSSSAAQITIADSSQYGDTVEVRAFIVNRIDSDGLCTVVFSKGTNKVTRTVSAQPDASTTQCGNINVPRNEFVTSGTWDITVSYKSPSATGEAKSTVDIR